ncbi:acetyltransferase [Gammaproteobacteria bacterium]|nr:acetyltransferase [Gammaproteobacteria bacterium]
MRTLIVLGTGSNAGLISDLVSDIGTHRITAFVENIDLERCGKEMYGKPVIWVDDLSAAKFGQEVINAMPIGMQTQFIDAVANHGFEYSKLIHPSAIISNSTRIDHGVTILAGSIVGPYTHIGAHSFINRGVIIGHDVDIGPRCVLNPGSNIAGACRIGEEVLIGMGALVRDHMEIGAHARVGMGAVVTRNVATNTIVYGNRARARN